MSRRGPKRPAVRSPVLWRHPPRSYCPYCGEYGGVDAIRHFLDAPLCWDDLLGFDSHRQEQDPKGDDDADGL